MNKAFNNSKSFRHPRVKGIRIFLKFLVTTSSFYEKTGEQKLFRPVLGFRIKRAHDNIRSDTISRSFFNDLATYDMLIVVSVPLPSPKWQFYTQFKKSNLFLITN